MTLSSDIAIIGGGPAGISCALILAKANVPCCVIERQREIPWKPGEIFDSRICIPLQQLGLWESFLQTNPTQVSGTHSSWGGEFIEKSAMIDPYGGAFFADRCCFEVLLRKSARDAGVLFLEGTGVTHSCRSRNGWELTLSDNTQSHRLHVKYTVEANGRGKSYCDSGARHDVDAMVALMGYVDLPLNYHDQRFHIEALDNGWAYIAPLPNQKLVIAFLTDAHCLPKGRSNHQRFYSEQVNRLAVVRQLPLRSISPVQVISAKSSIRRIISGCDWLSVGEAAATYDPITGWGVVSALEKGITAATLLLKSDLAAVGKYYDEFEKALFDKYLQTRRTIYALEQRWPEESFWAERHSAAKYSVA